MEKSQDENGAAINPRPAVRRQGNYIVLDEAMVEAGRLAGTKSNSVRTWPIEGRALKADGSLDDDNPLRGLSNGAVRKIEQTLRELPGIEDSDKYADLHLLTAARQVLAFRKLRTIN